MWGSIQMPTTTHRHTGKLEPLNHGDEDDNISVTSSSISQQRRRQPRRLPPASQQAQYARRLEIEAIEAKNRFTRELLQQQFTLLENHAKEVQDVAGEEEGACGEGRSTQNDRVPDNVASQGDHGQTVARKGRGSQKKKKRKKRKKERRREPKRNIPLTVDTSKSKSSVEVLRISLNELGWFWKEVRIQVLSQYTPIPIFFEAYMYMYGDFSTVEYVMMCDIKYVQICVIDYLPPGPFKYHGLQHI